MKKNNKATKDLVQSNVDQVGLMDRLPDEVVLHIFSFCAETLCQIACVCSKWHAFTQDTSLWRTVALDVVPFEVHESLHAKSKGDPQVYRDAVKEVAVRRKWAKERPTNRIIASYKAVGFAPAVKPRHDPEGLGKNKIKVTVLGDGGVGKTCMLVSYKTKGFPANYVPTVYDTYSTQMVIQSQPFEVTFCDTCGDEEYSDMRERLVYPQTDLFVMCFSLVRPSSFYNIKTKWYPEVNFHRPAGLIVLAGTKMDLLDDPSTIEAMTERGEELVPLEVIMEFAREISAIGFVPFSPSTHFSNLVTLFTTSLDTVASMKLGTECKAWDKTKKREKKRKEEKRKGKKGERCVVV